MSYPVTHSAIFQKSLIVGLAGGEAAFVVRTDMSLGGACPPGLGGNKESFPSL